MASETLSIVTRVQGAVQAARDIGKVGTAIDTVGTKAGRLRGKLSGLNSKVGNFLNNTGLGIEARYLGGQLGAEVIGGSNAGTGGAAGVAGNVLGGAAAGAAMAGPIGALAGAAVGTAKSAVEIGKASAEIAANVGETGRDFLKSNPTIDQLNSGIGALDKSLADLNANPLTFFLGGGDSAKELARLREEYVKQRAAILSEGAETEALLRANLNKAAAAPIVNVSVNANVNVSDTGTRVAYTSSATTPSYVYNPRTTG